MVSKYVAKIVTLLIIAILIVIANISFARSALNANDCITYDKDIDKSEWTIHIFTNKCSHDVMFEARIYANDPMFNENLFSNSVIIRPGKIHKRYLELEKAVSNSDGHDWAYVACRTRPTPFGIKKKLQLYDGKHGNNKDYWMDRLEFPPDFPGVYGTHIMYDDPPLTSKERELSTINGALTAFEGVVCWAEGDASASVTCTSTYAECLDRHGIPYDK